MSNNRFHALTSCQFENLAYDLLTWRGMRNAAWRTPGADGGRDIEGSYEVQDLSGAHQSQKWYVDCKRYASSVGWPTVYEKLSYADSNGADFLLIVCTPSVSPQCCTEIDKWNAKSPKTKIRTWEPHYLEQLLIEHPEVAIKHGFRKATLLDAPGFIDIAFEASKSADAAYCRSILENDKNIPELELASALANFLAAQMQQPRLNLPTSSLRDFIPANDSYDWLIFTATTSDVKQKIDALALRAVLCVIRLAAGGIQSIYLDSTNQGLVVSLEKSAPIKFNEATLKLLRKICLFGSIEMYIQVNSLILRGQQ